MVIFKWNSYQQSKNQIIAVIHLKMIAFTEQEDKPVPSGSEIAGQVSMSREIGDGGESGNIIPGKSVVFATLEVCLCVLVRHMPALNPAIPSTGFQISSLRQAAFSDATCQLLATTLQIMTDLPLLCSPAGKVNFQGQGLGSWLDFVGVVILLSVYMYV